MKPQIRLVLLSASLVALSACSKETNFARAFYSEAGSEIETADFGKSTSYNLAVQKGERDYAIDLTRRFGADVPATVHFAFNSYALEPETRQALMQQANWIRQFPEVRFRVYGHTDLVGSEAYNKRLGLRRAQAVVNFLVSQGVSRSRLEAVASFGKTQPLVFVQGPERKNRRTVTEVSGFVRSSNLVLNGKYAEIIMREYTTSAPLPKPGQQPVTSGGTASGT
ncbi:MAG: OmpA family protein [Proteobacteria bacterium]|nr:OmpA family protein [Pseudomonadota bacterium]MBS0574402.1 OmpA family protein [Pseudomonadota bacterium]